MQLTVPSRANKSATIPKILNLFKLIPLSIKNKNLNLNLGNNLPSKIPN